MCCSRAVINKIKSFIYLEMLRDKLVKQGSGRKKKQTQSLQSDKQGLPLFGAKEVYWKHLLVLQKAEMSICLRADSSFFFLCVFICGSVADSHKFTPSKSMSSVNTIASNHQATQLSHIEARTQSSGVCACGRKQTARQEFTIK